MRLQPFIPELFVSASHPSLHHLVFSTTHNVSAVWVFKNVWEICLCCSDRSCFWTGVCVLFCFNQRMFKLQLTMKLYWHKDAY